MYTLAAVVAAAHGCLIGIFVSVVVDADDGDEEQATVQDVDSTHNKPWQCLQTSIEIKQYLGICLNYLIWKVWLQCIVHMSTLSWTRVEWKLLKYLRCVSNIGLYPTSQDRYDKGCLWIINPAIFVTPSLNLLPTPYLANGRNLAEEINCSVNIYLMFHSYNIKSKYLK